MEVTSSSFYLTLPSNACKDRFPNNEAGCYKVKLAHPIKLKQDYEVALVEVQFTKSWFTLNQHCTEFWYDDGIGYVKYCLEQGFYDNVPAIIDCMTQQLKFNNISIEYSPITKLVKVYLRNGARIILQKGLRDILGLPERSEQTIEGTHVVDIRRGMTALYLYSDIGEPQFVGDALVPLLRIIDANGEHGEIITKMFSSPHYIPVRYKQIDTIEINICDDTGEIVSFSSGKVMCKLHLRLKQPML